MSHFDEFNKLYKVFKEGLLVLAGLCFAVLLLDYLFDTGLFATIATWIVGGVALVARGILVFIDGVSRAGGGVQ